MNRSIAKTRNQLQRITYKINQLKTKYTGDTYINTNLNHNGNHNGNYNANGNGNGNGNGNLQNSPSQYKQKQFVIDNKGRQQVLNSYYNKFNQHSGNKIERQSYGNQQIYQKQFKVFRNQMYNYIDKCILLSKQRQEELIQKTIQLHLQNSRNQNSNNIIEQRLKKIEEQTTDCISGNQDSIVQIKKNQKYFNDKISNLQQKLRKDIKQLQECVKNRKQDQKNDEKQQIIHKLLKIQNQYTIIKQNVDKLIKKDTILDENIHKINIKLQNIQKNFDKKFTQAYDSYEQLIISNCQTLKKQIQKCNINTVELEKIFLQVRNKVQNKQKNNKIQKIDEIKLQNTFKTEFQQKFNKFNENLNKNIQNITNLTLQIKQLNNKLQNSLQIQTQFKQQLQVQHKKIQSNQLKRKNSQKIQQSIKEKQKSQLTQILQQNLSTKIKENVQNMYLKPRLQQIRRQLSTKLLQDIQLTKQDLIINIQQNIYEKINKIEKQRKSPKIQLQTLLNQQIKQIESSLKNLIYEQLQIKKSRKQTQISQKDSQTHKTSPKSSQQAQITHNHNRVQQIIQQKLTQFQNDINQTIKLLYEDIENKVNQMLGNSGMMEFRVQVQNNKRDIKQLENKVQNLVILLGTQEKQEKQAIKQYNNLQRSAKLDVNVGKQQGKAKEVENLRINEIENLRVQVYNEMGQQIDKLSNVLERTVQQMETKVEKLDRNFSYVYERMSNIQYDNANFKDKLTSLLAGGRPSPFRTNKTAYEPQIKQNQSNNILDVLGQLNTGKAFFEDV